MKFLTKINPRFIKTSALLLLMLVALSGCVSTESYQLPADEGGIFSTIFVYPIAWLLFQATSILGGNLTLGIIVTTLAIRTLAWPVYAKGTNAMAQQQEIQPEIQKLQAKYAGKNDTASQQKMQAELREVYKKHGTSMLGCLYPFLQMPIFLAVYSAVIRFPNNLVEGTNTIIFSGNSLDIDPNLFGINILNTVSEGFTSGNYLYAGIPIVVAISMFLVQKNAQARTSKAQSDIPEYKRNPQAEGMAKQMKLVMYSTIVMMAVFTISAPALLGVYWTIGNFYSLFQSIITNKQRERKQRARLG